MSTSRVLEELKRICSVMRSLMFSKPKTSLMYVFMTVLHIKADEELRVPKCTALFLSWLQVMKKAHVARQRLLRLGIFKEVEVLIDTSEGNSFRPSFQKRVTTQFSIPQNPSVKESAFSKVYLLCRV